MGALPPRPTSPVGSGAGTDGWRTIFCSPARKIPASGPDCVKGVGHNCARRRSEDNFGANTIGIFGFLLYDEGIGRATRSNRTGGRDGTRVLGGRLGRCPR